MSSASDSPLLAQPPGPCCTSGVKHTGTPLGTVEFISGVETYIAIPPQASGTKKVWGVILFFSDVWSPLFVNNQLIMDWFAEGGFITVGLDYFERDPMYLHVDEPDWESVRKPIWMEVKKTRARELLPGWNEAIKERFGQDLKYFAVGYCFGAPIVMEVGTTDEIVAGAIAHPAILSESHVRDCKVPILLSCAEDDFTFPLPARRRAEDILVENKRTYHIQVFSGVEHGFAVRCDPEVENERWAKEESASAVLRWFRRFSV